MHTSEILIFIFIFPNIDNAQHIYIYTHKGHST